MMKRMGCFCLALCLLLAHALGETRADNERRYGAFAFWPPLEKAAYTSELLAVGKTPEDGRVYVAPNDGDISLETALRIAALALKMDSVTVYMHVSAGLVLNGDARVWRLVFIPKAYKAETQVCTLEIAAHDGAVLSMEAADNAVLTAYYAYLEAQRQVETLADALVKQHGVMYKSALPNEAAAQIDELALSLGLEPSDGLDYRTQTPLDTDVSQADALEMAWAALEKVGHGQARDRFAFEMRFKEHIRDAADRFWQVNVLYMPLACTPECLAAGDYPDGTQAVAQLAIAQDGAVHGMDAQRVLEAIAYGDKRVEVAREIAENGMWVTWQPEEIMKYSDIFALGDSIYIEPREGEISRETAVNIALDYWHKNALVYGLNRDEIDQFSITAYLESNTVYAADASVWFLFFYTQDMFSDGRLSCYEVRINAYTGEILLVLDPSANG